MSNPWKYRCPEGHSSWAPVNSNFIRVSAEGPYYCNICDERFEELQHKEAEQ